LKVFYGVLLQAKGLFEILQVEEFHQILLREVQEL
jgi:hypothetical protein